MISIPFFDDKYPVRTLISGQDDLPRDGWGIEASRNAMLTDFVGVNVNRVVYGEQTHSANVLAITEETPEGRLEHIDETLTVKWKNGYDSLVTSLPGVMLCVSTADCLPVFLYDTANHVIGIAHSGWRGTCGGIAINTIEVMRRLFGTKPENLTVALGPSICGDCYEVRQDVLQYFSDRYDSDEMRQIARPKEGDKYLLDNKAAVRLDLVKSGIIPEKIYDTGICSYESSNYASYRRDGRVEHYEQTLSGIVLM